MWRAAVAMAIIDVIIETNVCRAPHVPVLGHRPVMPPSLQDLQKLHENAVENASRHAQRSDSAAVAQRPMRMATQPALAASCRGLRRCW